MDPFGWRIAAAVVGALMVLVMCRLARRLTGSTALGLRRRPAALLRRAALRALPAGAARHLPGVLPALRRGLPGQRPRLVPRPAGAGWCDGPIRPATAGDRCAACCSARGCSLGGVCFGLAVGTKWTALYPLAAFGLLVWLVERRRPAVVRRAVAGAAVGARRRRPAFVQLVVVAVFVYVATWTGWLVHAHDTRSTSPRRSTRSSPATGDCDDETASDDRRDRVADRDEPDAYGLGEVMQSLRSLWYYHQDVYAFHTHFLNCSQPHLRSPSRRAGCCSTGRSASPPTPTSSRGTQGCDAPRGQRLPAPGAADRDARDLVGRLPSRCCSRW